jgi:arylsulfatase A-like enzyme
MIRDIFGRVLMINRRYLLKAINVCIIACVMLMNLCIAAQTNKYPNIILLMADDMGWGDVGFNGNTIIKTPSLDTLAAAGIKMNRFFAGAPVCSPTRGSCLTGRHPYRYGIWHANKGRLPVQEVTIPKVLSENGYATGHFGKWHLGIPNTEYRGKGGGKENYCFPEWFGYDEHFITHHSVATWDPFGPEGEKAKDADNPYFHNGKRVLDNITGDDSRIIMDRAIPFIDKAVKDHKPFFAVIWFHAPHKPIKAGLRYKAMYSQYTEEEQDYYGCITALDDQVGRLHKELKTLGVEDNTMIWFCSDNGPENRTPGTTGGLRARKRSLFSGGVGVPAFLYWPSHIKTGRVEEMLCSTLDYLPTIFEVVGVSMPDERPLDGISLVEVIKGKQKEREKAIPFRTNKHPKISFLKGDYKFLTDALEGKQDDMLFNITQDRSEENNVIDQHPQIAKPLKAGAREFIASAKRSHSGADYHDPAYKPAESWFADAESKRVSPSKASESDNTNKPKKKKRASNITE